MGSGKRVLSGKRMLAGILTAVMVISSVQLPGGIVWAKELSENGIVTDDGIGTVGENREGEGDASGLTGEGQSGSQTAPDESNDGTSESGETEGTAPDGGETTPDDGAVSGDDNTSDGENASGDENTSDGENASGDDSISDGDGASDDENTSGNEEAADDENTSDDENASEEENVPDGEEEDTESLKDGLLYPAGISENDLAETEQSEEMIEGEIEGAYQFGGAPAKQGNLSVYADSAYAEGAEEYLYAQMLERNKKIDLSAYNIPYDDSGVKTLRSLVSGVLNEHPELYFVERGYSYWNNGTIITAVGITYSDIYNDAAFQKGASSALACVDSQMSDLEKAVVLHDYLTVNCEYDYENYLADTIPSESYSAYGTLVNRTAVCQGYALTYKYLLNQVGIDCYMVTSDSMNHAWNMIVLDGQYYQVDVTWDDPTWDKIGRSVHTYMFRSDAAFAKHQDWRVTNGSSVVDYEATDTRYDNAFWTECDTPLVLVGDDCYYISFDSAAVLKKAAMNNITDFGTTVQNIGSWRVWNGNGNWVGAFSGLFRIGDRLYYNDSTSIYSIALDGTDKKKEFTADTSSGYIYGSAYCQGKVLYALHQTPNLEAKEVVLTADIDVGGGEPETPDNPPEDVKKLDLDNLSYTYTALDDTKISSAADGKPKLLIFYSNTCGNCQSTISGISSEIDRFEGVDLYALETTQKGKEEVAAFQKEYGCEEIVFSYDTTEGNKNSMFAYTRAAGLGSKITWPVICYIDANNRLQYVTSGLCGEEEILTNLELYTGRIKPAATASVSKLPDTTTYKVGETLDITGGRVKYPRGDGKWSVPMKADMISGFDSSKPGICTLTVTCEGYTTTFDVLIVEEPVLTAGYGQRLKELVLPPNDYGTYFWSPEVDSEQELLRIGEQTYAAVFTPDDAVHFQTLADLQIKVTTKRMLGNEFTAAFKKDDFTYNGIAQEPKVIVSVSGDGGSDGTGTVLIEGQDYELSYENNRNAGTATVIVTGVNDYLGSISREFEIKPAPLEIRAKDKAILLGDPIPAANEYEYETTGLLGNDALITKPSVSSGIVSTAVAGHYEIVPESADAGTNYTIKYVKGRLTVSSEYVACMVTFDVQGHGMAPAAMIDVRVGSTIDSPADPAAEGYRFGGWYTDTACTKAWDFETAIVQSDMTLYAKWFDIGDDSEFAIQEIADVYYTGKACKPVVHVYDGDILLKSGRDYQIKYYNNIAANKDGVLKQGNGEGEYFNSALPYVEIIGKGNYTDRIKDGNRDTVKVNFNILRTSIGDGSSLAANGIVLKISDQLAVAKKVQKPFTSIKYVKAMKKDVDFTVRLTAEHARDQEGRSLQRGLELSGAAIPAGYSGEFLLTVEGIGNYEGSICRTVYVSDKAHLIKNAAITIGKNQKNVTYAGRPVRLNAAEVSTPDTFIVKYGKTILKPGRDYTVSYRNHDRVGKAELIITGAGEYVGSKTASFTIKGRAFTAKTVQTQGIVDKVYTGRAITQNGAALTYDTGDGTPQSLRYGTDYTISYSRNINKGTATMTFKGAADAGYNGSFKKTFKIMAADIGKMKRSATMENMVFSYSKAGVKPVEEIRLTNEAGQTLRSGKDYTLKYTNNKAVAGASDENPPTVTVKGKGNYTGEFSLKFDIVKADLQAEGIQIKTTPMAYKENKAQDYVYKPAVKLMDGKSALRADKDYKIEYRNHTQADYESYIEKIRGQTTPGSDILQEGGPVAVITEAEGSPYRLEQPIVVPLPIYLHKLTAATLKVYVDETQTVYSGGQVTPDVTVSWGGGMIREGENYTVSYGKNIASGKKKGSVVISGVAPYYGGSVTVKFDIVKKPITY